MDIPEPEFIAPCHDSVFYMGIQTLSGLPMGTPSPRTRIVTKGRESELDQS